MTKHITVEEMRREFCNFVKYGDEVNTTVERSKLLALYDKHITQAQATAREECNREWEEDPMTKEHYERIVKTAREEERERITNLLDNWTEWTCHTRAEHEQNDCPGWSHEDQLIRETVISQVKELL